MENLVSINFIADGLVFPPNVSSERMEKYAENLLRYKTKHNDNKRLKVYTAGGMKDLNWSIPCTNYFKLVTDKTLGLILNEKPNLVCKDESITEELKSLVENSAFWSHFQEAVRCFSSMGDGVLYLYKTSNGEFGVNAINPQNWYKVGSVNNINETKCHILTQVIYEENFTDILLEDRITHLRVLYHYRGYYIEKYFAYDGVRISRAVEYINENGETVPIDGLKVLTGLSDFAIFDFSNSKAIDEMYGVSDYAMFDKLVELKEKKLAQLDGVTDKHFEPMIQGPRSKLVENEQTGKVEFRGLGNYIGLDGQDKDVKYVSWDAKTDTILDLIRKVDDEIAVLSEMGKAFLYGEFGNISGEALKTMIKGALDKVSRHIDTIEPTLKRLFVQMLYIGGIVSKPGDINIEWQDGISETDKSKADTISSRVNSGTLSRKRAIMKYDGLTVEQADDELNQIKKEGGSISNE